MRGPVTTIELDNEHTFFTSGDVITGRLIVTSEKSFSVKSINVSLRCEELAQVEVTTGGGPVLEKEIDRLYTRDVQVFPGEQVLASTQSSALRPSSSSSYTLGPGKHIFEFCLEVPELENIPESWFSRRSESGVVWYVKGVVHRPHWFTSAKRFRRLILVRKPQSINPDSSETVSETVSTTLTVAETADSQHCIFRDLLLQKQNQSQLKQHSDLKAQLEKEVGVKLTATIPKQGVLQHPWPLDARVQLTSSDDDLLLFKHFRLSLRNTTEITLSTTHQNIHQTVYDVAKLENINCTLKEGMKLVEAELNAATVRNRIQSTFASSKIKSNYKLEVEVYLSSTANPGGIKVINLSLPTEVHPHIPPRYSPGLPSYEGDSSDEKYAEPASIDAERRCIFE